MRDRRTRLGIVALTVFLDLLGFGIIIPLMPHYAESFGATPFTYGLLAASYSLMQFVFVPIWGRWSDRVGRRPILLISIAGSVVSMTLMGLADSLSGLFVARFLSGISAANLSVAQAYVADITRPEERARGMGLIGAAFGLGFVVGPFLGGEMSPHVLQVGDWTIARRGTLPFFAAALLSAGNWGLAWRLLPESIPPGLKAPARGARLFQPGRLLAATRESRAGGLFFISFLVTTAFSMMEQTLILFGERRLEMTPLHAGRLLGFVGVLMVVVQGGLVGRLARRFGEERLLVAGTALLVPGLLLIPPARSYLALALAMVPLAVGSGIGQPSLHSLISRRNRADEQGGILGVNQSLMSLARVVGPSVGGYVFGELGITAPFWIGGALMTVALVAAVRMTIAGVPESAMSAAKIVSASSNGNPPPASRATGPGRERS